jgi:hypothetical protein
MRLTRTPSLRRSSSHGRASVGDCARDFGAVSQHEDGDIVVGIDGLPAVTLAVPAANAQVRFRRGGTLG